MKHTFRLLSTLAALSALLLIAPACKNNGGTGQGPVAAAPGACEDGTGTTVVATIGTDRITMAQVDDSIKARLAELDEQRFEIRKQALDSMINEKLVAAEATKRGITKQQLLKQEVEDKSQAPTDAVVKDFFEQNRARLPPDAKLDEYKERIVAYMTRQQRDMRAQQVFDDLRKAASVTVSLAPPPKPRVEVAADGPARGPANAKVTIVEFSDFECPFCSRARDTVEEVMSAYPDKLRLVFRHFPLQFHEHAKKAAEASLCANDQGKFWEYHDFLFKNQQKLAVADLKDHAGKLGLDATKFGTCLDGGTFAQKVESDQDAGTKAGVSGTPAFFINGVFLSGAQPVDEFKKIIDQELTVAN